MFADLVRLTTILATRFVDLIKSSFVIYAHVRVIQSYWYSFEGAMEISGNLALYVRCHIATRVMSLLFSFKFYFINK